MSLLDGQPQQCSGQVILRDKLGSCHELFRRVLRRIVTGEIHVPGASRSRLDDFEMIGLFLDRFLNCLVPAPINRETKSLVRRARMTLAETIRSCPSAPRVQKLRMQKYGVTLDLYQDLHSAPDQARWELFNNMYLSAQSGAVENNMRKKFMKNEKRDFKVNFGEMCANCFEESLLDESNQTEGLMKCSQCQQLKYCSRECQLEHWKKAHKKQCKKV
jgi:MYND finger